MGISFGTITHEAQYIINYSFLILNLFIYLFVFYKKDTSKLKLTLLIANYIYILSIYLSVITKTFSSTYIEGSGIKGWFESGNSLGVILLISLFILSTMLNDKKYMKLIIPLIVLDGIFLMFLLGTRTRIFWIYFNMFFIPFVLCFYLYKKYYFK